MGGKHALAKRPHALLVHGQLTISSQMYPMVCSIACLACNGAAGFTQLVSSRGIKSVHCSSGSSMPAT